MCLVIHHIAVLPALSADAGVQQKLPSVRELHGTAGEAAVLIVLLVRSEGGGEPLPADEIPGLGVTPVHGPPFGVVGMILVEQVIFTLIYGKTVGIVDPAYAAGQVETGLFRHVDKRVVFRFKFPGLFQCVADHGYYSCV